MAANLDRAETSLTAVSDIAYIRGIDSSGNSVRISKADLASVLGVVNGGTKTTAIDPVDLSNNHFYWCDKLTNIPSIANSAGFVFKCPAFIMFASFNRSFLLFRFYDSVQSQWADWKKVTPESI